MGWLDYITLRHYNSLTSLEDNNITVTIKKSGKLSEWLNAKVISCTNASIVLLNMDNRIMYTKGNTCGIIDIPVIEFTFESYYIYVSHDMSKKYIYGYLI